MWSHYPDNNKGVCLEFKIDDDHKETVLGRLNPITYANGIFTQSGVELTESGHLSIDINSNGKFLRNKFKNWEYEQEIRTYFFCENPTLNGVESLFVGRLTGIYFGKNASDDNIEIVKNNATHLAKLRFYQVDLDLASMTIEVTAEI